MRWNGSLQLAGNSPLGMYGCVRGGEPDGEAADDGGIT
jgi:hypothetical protein